MISRFARANRTSTVIPPARPVLLVLLSLLPLLLAGCGEKGNDSALFELQPASRTGVTFANTITTSDSVNVQTDVYIYNGAGVAAGDIDNDGLPDLFFAGNMVSSRLYLNKGGMKFEDITKAAGVGTDRWATGVSMVDINGDGWLDIYVSVSGPEWSTPAARANLLFINNGRPDVHRVGGEVRRRLQRLHHARRLPRLRRRRLPRPLSSRELARATSPAPTSPESRRDAERDPRQLQPAPAQRLPRRGHFTNTSEQAGILRKSGYGLGVAVADVNNDGRPDLYVSNDVVTNDVLYVNNGDGTFTDKRPASIRHASYAGMGVDVADFNNDGWADVLQADMMAADLVRRKRTSGFMTYSGQLDSRSRGFLDDYSENTLQLNNGVGPGGDVTFSEIGRMAGVAHTDWSWSALFADFDNDGLKDIFIGNGYPKAVNDLDYMSATNAARRPGANASARKSGVEILRTLPSYDVSNYVFRNRGDLTFADQTRAWGLERPSLSFGAAYADLDNDGRLDLVVNNIDAEAFVYRNAQKQDSLHHFLGVILAGDAPNRRGVGARLVVTRRRTEAVPRRVAVSRLHVVDGRPRALRARERIARRHARGDLARRAAAAPHRRRGGSLRHAQAIRRQHADRRAGCPLHSASLCAGRRCARRPLPAQGAELGRLHHSVPPAVSRLATGTASRNRRREWRRARRPLRGRRRWERRRTLPAESRRKLRARRRPVGVRPRQAV